MEAVVSVLHSCQLGAELLDILETLPVMRTVHLRQEIVSLFLALLELPLEMMSPWLGRCPASGRLVNNCGGTAGTDDAGALGLGPLGFLEELVCIQVFVHTGNMVRHVVLAREATSGPLAARIRTEVLRGMVHAMGLALVPCQDSLGRKGLVLAGRMVTDVGLQGLLEMLTRRRKYG
jgi:hypothetical protein